MLELDPGGWAGQEGRVLGEIEDRQTGAGQGDDDQHDGDGSVAVGAGRGELTSGGAQESTIRPTTPSAAQ